MTTKKQKPLLPIKPYDDHINEHFTLYDNMPYSWDSDFERHLSLVSGNVIKGYRCKIKEPYKIDH